LASAPASCVATRGLGPAQRASFLYFASPRFADEADAAYCGWLLIQDDGELDSALLAPRPGLAPAWQGQRRPNRAERFLLFRVDASPTAAPSPAPSSGHRSPAIDRRLP